MRLAPLPAETELLDSRLELEVRALVDDVPDVSDSNSVETEASVLAAIESKCDAADVLTESTLLLPAAFVNAAVMEAGIIHKSAPADEHSEYAKEVALTTSPLEHSTAMH